MPSNFTFDFNACTPIKLELRCIEFDGNIFGNF